MVKQRFYFTFGTDRRFPFCGGWVEILAKDMQAAQKIFEQHYPSRPGSDLLNCAFCYTEDDFKKTLMYRQDNWGRRCWEVLE